MSRSTTLLNQDQISMFQKEGFVLGPQLLDDDQVDVLRTEIERVIRDKGKDDTPQPFSLRNISKSESPVWQIINIWQGSSEFEQLGKDPILGVTISQP